MMSETSIALFQKSMSVDGVCSVGLGIIRDFQSSSLNMFQPAYTLSLQAT
jgi:hypothetical protein